MILWKSLLDQYMTKIRNPEFWLKEDKAESWQSRSEVILRNSGRTECNFFPNEEFNPTRWDKCSRIFQRMGKYTIHNISLYIPSCKQLTCLLLAISYTLENVENVNCIEMSNFSAENIDNVDNTYVLFSISYLKQSRYEWDTLQPLSLCHPPSHWHKSEFTSKDTTLLLKTLADIHINWWPGSLYVATDKCCIPIHSSCGCPNSSRNS